MSKQFLALMFVVVFSSCDNGVTKKSNPCANDPCVNGACVVTGESSIRCECEEGFTGWLCDACAEGYEPDGNGGCEPIVVDPCDPNPCENGECVVTGETSIQCECEVGYEGLLCDACAEGYQPDGNGGCEPIVVNPCSPNPCENGECVVDGEAFVCDCDEGYTGTLCADCAVGFVQLNNGTCVVDDCQNQTCAGHGTCSVDLDTGVASCACDAGYSPDGLDCVDTNECLSNPCPEHSNCTNLDGSYECECTVGYTGLACDECALGFVEVGGECVANTCDPNPCQHGGTCSISGGVATCACTSGYTGTYCEDCSAGYVRLNNGTCVVDACTGQTCSGHGTCSMNLNTGVASCACTSGFTASGLSCLDVNECLGSPCDANATCANSVGSFSCACNSGYTGNGFTCSDVDECASNPCNVNATCANTIGSFTCECNTGYTGDGFVCSNVNECLSNPCHVNATCTDTVGSFSCACNSGFTGNGFSCSDINECASNPCPVNSTCSNLPGSYVCACNTGYTGSNCDLCDEANGYEWDGSACVVSPCFGEDCNGHGTCSVVAGNPVCDCETGYTGSECSECSANYRLLGGFCQPMFARLAGGAIFEFAEANGDLYAFGQNEVVVRYDEVEDTWVEVWRPDIAWTGDNDASSIRSDFMAAVSNGSTVYLLQKYFAMEEYTNITGSNRNIVRTFTPGGANPWGQIADIPPTGTQINPIRCNDLGVNASGDLLWAVCDDGTVYKYQFATDTWQAELVHDSTGLALNKIWVESSDSIFVAGDAGFLKRWNGASWEDWRSASLDTDLYGVWGYASSDLYVGGRGKLWHWNGSSWTLKFSQVSNPTKHYVRKIHGTSDHSRIVALSIGDWNDWIQYTSHVWQSVSGGAWSSPGASMYYWSVYCSSLVDDSCYLGGSNGTVDKATRLVRVSSGGEERMIYVTLEPRAVFGNSPDDILFPALNTATHFNGNRYTDLPLSSVGEAGNLSFMDTWSNGLGYWIVGPRNYVLYWDGLGYGVSNLTKHLIDTADFLSTDMIYAVHGSSASNVWAAGSKGATFRWDGASWTRYNLPHTNVRIKGLLVVSSTEVYATARDWDSADYVRVYRWDGSAWTVVYTHAEASYYPHNIIYDGENYCAGLQHGSNSKVICSEDGMTWSVFITVSYPRSIEKIWGSKNNLFAFGQDGKVFNFRSGQQIDVHRETSNIDDDEGSLRLVDVWKDPASDFTVIIGVASKVLIHR